MKTTPQASGCAGGLIEVTGLCTPHDVTQVISQNPYWKQMHITEVLEIPPQKPNAEQINAVDVSVTILRAQVIVSPRSYDDTDTTPVPQPNLEGKLLTGRKLIIEGQLCQKVVYTALAPSQPVHSAHFYVPFSSFIVVPRELRFPQGDLVDALDVRFDVNACVEDVSVCLLDQRRLLKQVTLMLYAVPTRGC